jgi:hypothetical protein
MDPLPGHPEDLGSVGSRGQRGEVGTQRFGLELFWGAYSQVDNLPSRDRAEDGTNELCGSPRRRDRVPLVQFDDQPKTRALGAVGDGGVPPLGSLVQRDKVLLPEWGRGDNGDLRDPFARGRSSFLRWDRCSFFDGGGNGRPCVRTAVTPIP